MHDTLHRAQIIILNTLRHYTTARYSDLRLPTGMESDVFKFHIRTLHKAGYIEKLPNGQYRLTRSGKEFANDLYETDRTRQHQPKLSILLFAKNKTLLGGIISFSSSENAIRTLTSGVVSADRQSGA